MCENLISTGTFMRTPAEAHLIQSAVDQVVHQGTGGYFESVSTWKKKKKKKPPCSE